VPGETPYEDAPDVVRQFARELAELRQLHGSPSFARMHEAIRHSQGAAGSKNTFHRMVTHPDRIYEPEYVRGFVLALGLDADEAAEWEQRRRAAVRQYQMRLSGDAPGQAAAKDPPNRTSRSHRPLLVASIALAILAVLLFTGYRVLGAHGRRGGLPTTASAPRTIAGQPADGSDPVDNGCSLDPDVAIIDRAEVDYHGQPAGSAQLVYSPRCGVAWPRFQPFAASDIPRGTAVHVDVVRADDKSTRSSFRQPFTGEPIYGNVLRSTESCVYAAVRLGLDAVESRTHCFRGRTPSDISAP
jgi:hypothetical protein